MRDGAQILGRVLLYVSLVIVSYLVFLAELNFVEDPSQYFFDFGFVEWWQLIMLLLAIGVMVGIAKRYEKNRQLGVLSLALMLCMAVRETDVFLDAYVFDGAWQALVVTILALTGFALRRDWGVIGSQLRSVSDTSSFGFGVSAILTVVVFSRLFGRNMQLKRARRRLVTRCY